MYRMDGVFIIRLRDIYFARDASNITIVMDMMKMDIGKFPKMRTLRT
jgi:hypothetical protein